MDMHHSENELFETETMAELCARQGRLSEAVAIYRRLVDDGGAAFTHAAPERRNRWAGRLAALEKAWGYAAGEELEPEAIPLPSAPGVAVAANDDSVTVAWSLADAIPEPTMELLLIQKTPSGVETSKRTLRLITPTGRLAFAVPALHSALAAVGRRQGDRFVPLARSTRNS
jgi:hypothetical protein